MNRKWGAIALGVAWIGSGCVGANNASLSTVVEALEGATQPSPFVEGYVQYIGPDARWAGPALWTLHVSARDGAAPLVELTPALVKTEDAGGVQVSNRAPASVLGLTQANPATIQAAKPALAAEQVTERLRDRLAHLAGLVQAGDASNEACSTAVKVRLTRADGSVVEKQGCRASTNWSQVVSEVSTEWIGLSTQKIAEKVAQTATVVPTAPAVAPAVAPGVGEAQRAPAGNQ